MKKRILHIPLMVALLLAVMSGPALADNLDKFCMLVAAGNGRLKDCLEKNDSKVSSRCKDAMKQVGLK